MKILVINAGSSSLKYQLFNMDNDEVMAKGGFERIGSGTPGKFKHSATGFEDKVTMVQVDSHKDAIELLVKALLAEDGGVIKDMKEIDAVGHRVLHGGAKFSGSVLIDDAVIAAIEECIPLGPLHNPANLTGINACKAVIGNVPQVAVFDTAFHQTMPDYAYMYALPYKFYEENKIRRYGFHGTSHRFVSAEAAKFMGKKPGDSFRVITCHLGNGSSISAVKDGKCVDTTMGLTPLEGIMMGTRCGTVDPAVVKVLIDTGLTAAEVDNIMNKQSGFLGVSGQWSDHRDILEQAAAGNDRARLADEMFEYQLLKYIGGFAAAMGGVDAIVFTGGIGENCKEVRQNIGDRLAWLGAKVDPEKNSVRGVLRDVSADDAKVRILLVPTNEELMIAMDTRDIVSKL
ncbi:MAG: acetate kinase [Clostridia bacterium]|nr:acetate kinase [Clostridia bacterium]